jgi:hypothetical protein
MNRPLRIALALCAVAGASSVFAQSMGSNGDTLYQRYLRGEAAIDRMPQTAGATRPAASPDAQYLIYLGVEPRVAVEQAPALGERPQAARTASAVELPINGYDLYARNASAAAAATRDTHRAMR